MGWIGVLFYGLGWCIILWFGLVYYFMEKIEIFDFVPKSFIPIFLDIPCSHIQKN